MLSHGYIVRNMARHAADKALSKSLEAQNQIRTSNAICEAIPNRNNVWSHIFYEHGQRSRSNFNFWEFKYLEATAVRDRVIDQVLLAHGEGRSVPIYVDFIY
jgi:hypothetical protein